ncbi:MAG: hypothetical protein ACFCVD_02975 [Nodosilinea sp.]
MTPTTVTVTEKQTTAEVEAAPPSVPALPNNIPAANTPDEAGIVGLTPAPGDDMGIGHLRPSDLTSLAGSNWRTSPILNAGWLRGVALPIYVGPGGELWGWLVNGWLIPNGYDPIAIGGDATFSMVQAERGLYSFPVMEIRPDGWFRFQYTPAGTAWAHVSQLNLGPTTLTLERWEDYLGVADQIKFRKHGVAQPLHPSPRRSGSLLALVGSNSLIEPLEVQGNWIRVKVTQPARGCSPLPGASSEEGWMQWRDDRQMLLVWFPTNESCEF